MSKKTVFLSVITTVIIISLFTLSFYGCNDIPVSPRETVSYSQDIQPVFTTNCSFPGCHNSIDKRAGIDLTSWESLILNGSDFGAEVIPYNSRWSHMLMHINRVDTNISPFSEPLMPKVKVPYANGQPLLRNTIELITKWIDQGAKNDNGEAAFSNIPRKAFITNQSVDFVAVVNLDNNHLTRLIKVGEEPAGILASPHVIITDNAGRYFYVSLINEKYLEKYDAMTYQKLGRFYTGSSPAHIVISNDGTKGYFSNFDATLQEKTIKEFDTQTMTITNVITEFRMKRPHGLRLTHNGSLLLTVTQGSEFLYVIRTSDHQVEDEYPVDVSVPINGNGTQNFLPYQIAITPDDRYALVACLKSNDVRVFDILSRSFILTIPVGATPLGLEISPDGRWCYVPNRNSNSVSIIDMQTFTINKTIPNVGVQPHMLDFTYDGHYCYVTCESVSGTFVHHPTTSSQKPGTTAVIDVWGGHVKIKDIEMASFPAGISITPGKGN